MLPVGLFHKRETWTPIKDAKNSGCPHFLSKSPLLPLRLRNVWR
jgi:hypothetical protein